MTEHQAKILSQFVYQVAELACKTVAVFVDKEETEKQHQIFTVNQETRLLNKKEIAGRLGISERTVSELQTEGLPIVKIGKRVLFDYEDVLDWLKNRGIKKGRKNNLRVVK